MPSIAVSWECPIWVPVIPIPFKQYCRDQHPLPSISSGVWPGVKCYTTQYVYIPLVHGHFWLKLTKNTDWCKRSKPKKYRGICCQIISFFVTIFVLSAMFDVAYSLITCYSLNGALLWSLKNEKTFVCWSEPLVLIFELDILDFSLRNIIIDREPIYWQLDDWNLEP